MLVEVMMLIPCYSAMSSFVGFAETYPEKSW